jgi:hypothetical protein
MFISFQKNWFGIVSAIVIFAIVIFALLFKLSVCQIRSDLSLKREAFAEPEEDTCSLTNKKPWSDSDSIKITNVIDFTKNLQQASYQFLGVTNGEAEYVFLKKNKSVLTSLTDPSVRTIFCQDQSALALAELLVNRVLTDHTDILQKKIKQLPSKQYIDQHCNAFDFNDNMFVDFMNEYGNNDILFVKLNSVFDQNYQRYFKDFLLHKHLQTVELVDLNNTSPEMIQDCQKKFTWHIFGGHLEHLKVIYMDDILCHNKDHMKSVDLKQLIKQHTFNMSKTQTYIDLFECQIPKEIEQEMKLLGTNASATASLGRSDPMRSSSTTPHQQQPSCESDQYFSNYNNYRCLQNNFIDIFFPFAFDYTISLTEHDFNTLIIKGPTFNEIIPIKNIFSKDPKQLSRYKVNIDVSTYPREHFIDDIYYGTDVIVANDIEDRAANSLALLSKPLGGPAPSPHPDNKSHYTVLTNSIPFHFDDTKHVFKKVVLGADERDTYFVYQADFQDILSNYVTKNNTKINVKLLENDRVFFDPKKLNAGEMEITLNNEFTFNDRNLFHGNVELNKVLVDDNGQIFQSLVIRLFSIRQSAHAKVKAAETSEITDNLEEGSCFDKTFMIDHESKTRSDCEQKGHMWDTPCQYNYECPFFQKNKNYPNVFGGCNNGYCEMPKGITRQTFKRYDQKKNSPICNNCDIWTGEGQQDMDNCCDPNRPTEKDGTNKKDLIAMKSPDYLFEGDDAARIEHLYSVNDCKKKSLKVNKYV